LRIRDELTDDSCQHGERDAKNDERSIHSIGSKEISTQRGDVNGGKAKTADNNAVIRPFFSGGNHLTAAGVRMHIRDQFLFPPHSETMMTGIMLSVRQNLKQ